MDPVPLATPIDPPDVGRLYKHYKGDYYRVIELGRLSEQRDTWMVVYRSMKLGHIWIRPLAMWNEELVWPDGQLRRRFTPASCFSDEGAGLR